MEKELNPLESLEIIKRTIEEAKGRFQDNGWMYIFWGTIIVICATGQFILQSYYPMYAPLIWLLTIAGFIQNMVYFARKAKQGKRSKNVISTILKAIGFSVGINISILGFGFWPYYNVAFVPTVIIFLSLYTIIIGRAIEFKQMFNIGVLVNILSFGMFFVDLKYQPLGLAAAAILLLLIPGLLLNRMKKT
ncbi:MAG: hypothetical protein Sapg2KO_00250 [Saprospiraceae bacterium]